MRELIILLNSITRTYSDDYAAINWVQINELELLEEYIVKIKDIAARIDKIFSDLLS